MLFLKKVKKNDKKMQKNAQKMAQKKAKNAPMLRQTAYIKGAIFAENCTHIYIFFVSVSDTPRLKNQRGTLLFARLGVKTNRVKF
tara:strand:+ start:182 stop:436 length:255 start_codon:yes stop_codon:yes gene_type:complete